FSLPAYAGYMTLWLDQSFVVSMDGPAGVTLAKVHRPFLRIGSDPAADVVLNGDGVTRRSVYVHGTAQGAYAVILQSANGSLHPQSFWVPADRPLEVGSHRLSIALEGQDHRSQPITALMARNSTDGPRPKVDIHYGDK